MTIADIVARAKPEHHFHGDYKIPWHRRAFSKRLLDEHLDQTHDAASRPFDVIDLHVKWIEQHALNGGRGRILDLCCGPGFYASRLTKRGHSCVGIDFAPSSIAYAEAEAQDQGLTCDYRMGDVRTVDYGEDFDLTMMLFGEFTAFAAHEAQTILAKMHAALAPGGRIVLEPQRLDSLQCHGNEAPFWARQDAGLFSDRPHIYLEEHFWDDDNHVLTDRYYVVDAESATATEFVNTRKGYTQAELAALLHTAGFTDLEFHVSLTGSAETADEDCLVVMAVKA